MKQNLPSISVRLMNFLFILLALLSASTAFGPVSKQSQLPTSTIRLRTINTRIFQSILEAEDEYLEIATKSEMLEKPDVRAKSHRTCIFTRGTD